MNPGEQNIDPALTKEQTIVELIEAVVHRHAQKLALRSSRYQFTYDQLNRQANRIARALLETKHPSPTGVALLFGDAVLDIVGMVGALKAGSYYVVLDARYPQERLNYILQDAAPKTILTNQEYLPLAEKLSNGDYQTLVLDALEGNDEDLENPVNLEPDSIISISYTSGSTGTPKGIPKKHRHLTRFNKGPDNEIERITPDDRSLLVFPTVSAASTSIIFRTLIFGASLHPFEIETRGLAGLPEWVRDEQITIFPATASLFRNMTTLLSDDDEFPHLRMFRIGGEMILPSDIALFKKHFSKYSRMWISYASSEAGGIAGNIIDASTQLEENVVPVGFPNKDKEILIWDDDGSELKRGEVGEIVVRTREHRPQYWVEGQRSANYLTDPDDPEAILHRTGDLGRLLPDGQLVVHGRKDDMVKVRGYRVDVSEIQNALLTLPNITNAAVVGWEKSPGEKYLLAYIVEEPGTHWQINALRLNLAEILPDYMIPSYFLFVDKIPLASSGKVDTKSLPKPDGSRPDLGYSLTPPSDEIETQLVQVWETVMDVRPIGVEDNFFDLGGHSLLAVQLFAEMEKAFSKKLPISILLTASTIKEQAAILENGGSDEAWSPLVPVQTEGAQPPLYCIPGRGGNPIRFNDLAKRMGAGQPIYMLQSRGLSGRTNPLSDIRKIAADFVAAIRTVQPNGPYFFLGSSSGGKVAYEMAQQLRAAGEETGLVVMIDTYGPGYPVYLSERSAVIKWTSRRVQQLQKHLGNLKVLSWKERWAYLGRYLKVSGTFLSDRTSAVKVRWDEERLEDLPDELVQVERANVQAARNYKPKPYAGKVVIFRATEQPKGIVEDLTLGWGKIQIADFSVVDVPGHHGSILVEPRVAALAEALNEQIGLVRQGD